MSFLPHCQSLKMFFFSQTNFNIINCVFFDRGKCFESEKIFVLKISDDAVIYSDEFNKIVMYNLKMKYKKKNQYVDWKHLRS